MTSGSVMGLEFALTNRSACDVISILNTLAIARARNFRGT